MKRKNRIILLALLSIFLLVGVLISSKIDKTQIAMVPSKNLHFRSQSKLFEADGSPHMTFERVGWESGISPSKIVPPPPSHLNHAGKIIPLSGNDALLIQNGYEDKSGYNIYHAEEFYIILQRTGDETTSITIQIMGAPNDLRLIWEMSAQHPATIELPMPPGIDDLEKQFGTELLRNRDYHLFRYLLPF